MTVIQNRELKNVLVLGDAIAPTGFARVIYEVMSPLCHNFMVSQMGVNYQGEPHQWPWRIYRANKNGDHFGIKRLAGLLTAIKPDLIFMLSDDVVMVEWMNIINDWAGRTTTRVIAYCPVDSGPIMATVIKALRMADRIFTFTEFGRQCFNNNFAAQPGTAAVKIELMPHGVSTTDFYPLENDIHFHLSAEGRLRAKRNLMNGDTQLDDTFIVLNANRNQERKRQDITLRGFAQFAAGKPATVMLYCHCGVKDIGWDLIDLATREGIADRLILTTTKPGKPAVPNSELNKIYNACDAGINTSSSEGWGLVSFEHAATGAAQIVPDHTGTSELWQGYAEMLAPAVSITYTERLTEQYIITPATVASSLERLYHDKNYLCRMSLAAYVNATKPAYNWQAISNKWAEIFREELDILAYQLLKR